jgi:hypothetical protein
VSPAVRTLSAEAEHHEEIKKSRFVARAAPVASIEQALAFVGRVRDPAASHNCWAYRIGQAYRFSDDGEPGLSNVALLTETGVMAVTDEEGRFVFPDMPAGDHVIRVDLTTMPRGYTLLRMGTRSAGNPKSQFCRLQFGGISKANFAVEGQGPRVGSARPGTPLLEWTDGQTAR